MVEWVIFDGEIMRSHISNANKNITSKQWIY